MARPAKRRRCRNCHALTWVGLDNDQCAFTARTDLKPLTAIGEALAQLTGRQTYDLTADDQDRDARTITRRAWWHITHRPAGTHNPTVIADVVAEHRCHTELPTTPSVIPKRTRPTAGGIDELPPF